MRHRGRPLHRRPPKLEPRPRLLIICEGRVTEPSYFHGLIHEEEIRSVEVIVDDEGGTPKRLVKGPWIVRKPLEKRLAERGIRTCCMTRYGVFSTSTITRGSSMPNNKPELIISRSRYPTLALSSGCLCISKIEELGPSPRRANRMLRPNEGL